MSNKRKRGKKIYWTSLLIYMLLLCAAAFVGLKMVWRYAEEYENSRPVKVVDAYVAQLSENLWDQSIADTIAAMPHAVQSDEEVAEHVKEMLKGGITYQRQGSSDSGTVINYSLLCNGHAFGTVSLVQDESAKDDIQFGMLPWKISNEEFDFNGLYSSVSVTVPSAYQVYLNDVLLGSEYIVEEGIQYDVLKDYYEDFAGLPTKSKYQYDNAIGDLAFAIKDEEGNDFVIDETRDDSQFIKPCSGDQLERLSDFATHFADRYFNYMTSGERVDPMDAYGRLKPYLKLGSDLDERMKQALDGMSYGHTTSYKLKSAVLNGALELGDGYYMCDITAVTTIAYPGKGEVENTNNMRVICVNEDDDILAISQEMY